MTYTATVSNIQGNNTTATPTGGSVTFTVDGTAFPVTLVNGTASYTTTFSTATTHTVAAAYSGSTNFTSSTATTLTPTVFQAGTVTTVVSGHNPSVFGQSVIFTATVSNQMTGGAVPTSGNVTFNVDGTATVVALSGSNSAILLVTNFNSAGNHTVVATYNGNSIFGPSNPSATLSQVVNSANTTITISSMQNPSVYGQSVTFTATVTAASPSVATVTDGTVTFNIPNVTTTAVNVVNGHASFTTSAMNAGLNQITASYSGDNLDFNGSSTTTTLTQDVLTTPTTTAVSSGLNPVVIGQPVMFTATVTNQTAGGATPTGGTVTFFINGTAQANPATLTNGTAIFTTTFSSAASYAITAQYAGSGNFSSSNLSPAVSEAVNKDSTTATVSASSNPSVVGQQVTFTATVVSNLTGGPNPTTGTVTFTVDNINQSPVSLNASTNLATFTTSFGTTGPHTVTATYNGNATFLASMPSATWTQTVNQALTTTTVSSGANPSVYGQNITFVATVSAMSPGAGTPNGGQVTFAVNGVNQSPVTVNSNEQASITISGLAAGADQITATYGGDGVNFAASAPSPALTQNVSPAPTSTTVTGSPNPVALGAPATFTATVSTSASGAGTPTGGTVTFVVDGVSQTTTVPLTNGTASSPISFSTTGPHTVAAIYNGGSGSNFAASALSQSFTETVSPANTVSTVSSSINPSGLGQSVTFTDTVTNQSAGGATPTSGTVTFVVDGTTEPAVSLSGSNLATFTTSLATAGSHTITAMYNGSTSFAASPASSAFTQNVSQGATSVVVGSLQNPSVYGATTLTATVSAGTQGVGTPNGGTVTFVVDGFGQTPVPVTNGSASLPINALTVGQHTVTASYSGNGNFNPSSQSPTFHQTVNPAPTTTSVSATLSSVAVNVPMTFTATVSSSVSGAGTPTGGTVTFVVDGVSQTTPVPLSNGTATSAITFTTPGAHTVAAIYNSGTGSNFAPSALSPNYTETGTANGTATAVSSSVNPSALGQSVTFTATVSNPQGGSAPTTGTVTFTVDGASQTPVNLNGSSVVTYTTSFTTANAHMVTATYNGNANFGASQSPTLTQTVNRGATTLVVGSSLNPSLYGATTLTATVAAQATGVGTPTGGTVTFVVDGVNQTPAPVSNGSASLALNTLAAGSHTITASYSGDNANFNGSTSTTTFTQTVNKAPTSTSVSASVNPAALGQSVTFTATVTSTSSGAGAPTGGTVTFVVDGVSQTPVALTNGTATISTSFSTTGSHTVTATYNGGSNFAASLTSPTLTEAVSLVGTSTALSSSANPSGLGQPVIFTATVSSLPAGSGTPTGTVTFTIDGTAVSSPSLNGNGQAIFTTSSLTFGTHTVTATYNGNANFSASPPSSTLTQKVLNSTTTTIGSSVNPSVFGQSVTYTATVGSSAGAPMTGTVTFVVDGTSQAPVNLSTSGQASITLSNLAVGSNTVSATYSGDNTNFAPSSTTTPVTETENKDTSTTTIGSNLSTTVYGQPVTLYAAAWAFPPGAGTPTGTETIYIDNVSQGPITLASGVNYVTFTLSTLSVGSHTIFTKYSGDGNFNSSTSAPLTYTVTKDAASNTDSANVSASVFGQTVTLYGAAWAFAPGGGTPTGTVTYYVDGSSKGTATIGTNVNYATLNLSNLSVGTHTIQTAYSGDADFSASSSTALTFKVYQASTVTAVSVSSNTLGIGQPLAIYGAAYALPPGAGTPTGSMVFYVDGAYAGTEATVSGTDYGVLPLSSLPVGTHTISVVYSGNGNFAGSNSATTTVTVADSSGAVSMFATTSVANNNVPVGATFSVFAQVFTASGNLATSFTNRPATLQAIAVPSGGALTGSAGDSFSATFVNGSVEFDGLTVTASGTYTFLISTSTLTYQLTFSTFGRQI